MLRLYRVLGFTYVPHLPEICCIACFFIDSYIEDEFFYYTNYYFGRCVNNALNIKVSA